MKPVLLAVDEPAQLSIVVHELRSRYRRDYTIMGEASPVRALRKLESFGRTDAPVAMVLSGSGDLLARIRQIRPMAKRILLTRWGDRSTTRAILRFMTLGQIDYYLAVPPRIPDEQFHRVISECLDEWARAAGSRFLAARIVGAPRAARSHELRDVLGRNGVTYTFAAADSREGRHLLRTAGVSSSSLPVIVLYDGTVLVDPPNSRIAEVFGVTNTPEGTIDLAILGAGPAGLAAGVYAASEGLSTLLLEGEAIGGQAGSSSMIRNYLGFPRGVSGAELALRAFEQAWLFGAMPRIAHSATGLRRVDDCFVVETSEGPGISARSVIIATGMSYRRLNVPGLDRLIGSGVFYGAALSEAQAMEGQEIFVAGGGNSAGQAALHLARYAKKVVMLVRSPTLSAQMSDYLVREIASSPRIDVRTGVEVAGGGGNGSLGWINVRDIANGKTVTVAASALFVLIGGQPRTDWIPPDIERDEKGYILTGANLVRDGRLPAAWPLTRAPGLLETSMPGVFAAGDVRHRSVKRVASAVGEGAIAVTLVHEFLSAEPALPR